ncbi:hypothetical protein TNCV_4201331 [Trichonephila clavipes]|uniref:Uncharacterized protein n=1 Tax=Trichonephila clavipes TaxID=2585209 RepID=A0A8X6WBM9_TRICX|nr:hypothetical protein TNCV_4201331 [Trichonephila clavipes]
MCVGIMRLIGVIIRHRRRDFIVKREIIDYHINKMLEMGTISLIQSPYASLMGLCHKNNGLPSESSEAYRSAIAYRKLNAIIKYRRYPLPLIADLIMNIPGHTVMTTIHLRSG